MHQAKEQTAPTVWTENEVADFLQVKNFTLRKWRREGGGPPFVRCGERLIRYTPADVHAWLSKNSFGSSAHELGSPQTPAKQSGQGPAKLISES